MNRVVLAWVAVAALAGAGIIGWFEVRQTRDFRRFLAIGDAALTQNQTSAAVEAYSGAIALRRDSMLGWLKRGDTYKRAGDLSSALRDLEQAASLDPDAPRPMELLGDVSDALGDHGKAVEHYERFIAIDDRSPRVLYKLALAHYRGGAPSAAIDPVRRAIALDRQFTEAYYLLGLCERAAKRPEPAAAAFQRALTINASFAAAREQLADLESDRGRRRESLEHLEALAALEPTADRFIELAQAYARASRTDSAVLTLARATERHRESPGIHLALARIWLDVAERDDDVVTANKADAAIAAAAERHPPVSELALLRGRLQLLRGQVKEAEESLQAATASLPVEPAAFRYLADAARRLGHREVAHRAETRFQALAE